MTDPLMYREDAYVLLEPSQPERFLSPTEMLDTLKAVLADQQENLPPDLQRFSSIDEQAKHLLDTSCEFDLAPGRHIQWYAVRLEK